MKLSAFDKDFRGTNRIIYGVWGLIAFLWVLGIAALIALVVSLANTGSEGLARKIGHAAGSMVAAFDQAKDEKAPKKEQTAR